MIVCRYVAFLTFSNRYIFYLTRKSMNLSPLANLWLAWWWLIHHVISYHFRAFFYSPNILSIPYDPIPICKAIIPISYWMDNKQNEVRSHAKIPMLMSRVWIFQIWVNSDSFLENHWCDFFNPSKCFFTFK